MAQQRVLLVDDDTDLIAINRRTLERAGYRVLVAHDGDEGFALASANAVDVAILDVVMRTRDEGFVLARRLRADPRTAGIPLVMLTSLNALNEAEGLRFRYSDRDRDETFLPVDRFVDKPVQGPQLLALVEELSKGAR